MQSKKAFVITPDDMMLKMKLEFNDFSQNTLSSRHAINFVLTAHHLKEWVWKSYLENNEKARVAISPEIIDVKTYYSFLNLECGEIKILHELANNIKHFYSISDEIQETTSNLKNWEEIDCTWESWDIPYGYNGFIIISKENRWISALEIFQKVHNYWNNFFEMFLQSINH